MNKIVSLTNENIIKMTILNSAALACLSMDSSFGKKNQVEIQCHRLSIVDLNLGNLGKEEIASYIDR